MFSACIKDDETVDATPGGQPKTESEPVEGNPTMKDEQEVDHNTVATFDGDWKNNHEQAFSVKDGIITMGHITQEIHSYADYFQLANSPWRMEKTGKKETNAVWTRTNDSGVVQEVVWTLIDYDTDVEEKKEKMNAEFGDAQDAVERMMSRCIVVPVNDEPEPEVVKAKEVKAKEEPESDAKEPEVDADELEAE